MKYEDVRRSTVKYEEVPRSPWKSLEVQRSPEKSREVQRSTKSTEVRLFPLAETTVLDPAIELDSYLNDPIRTSFSQYWSHSPLNILKKIVQRVFSVQASSAPIERVFSHAGLILSSRRTNMSEQLFRDLVFLRVNQSLL